jgi:hypothetical protein
MIICAFLGRTITNLVLYYHLALTVDQNEHAKDGATKKRKKLMSHVHVLCMHTTVRG